MTWFFIYLILTTNPSRAQTLAPHPVYFSVTGQNAVERVKVDGKQYKVEWKNNQFSIDEDDKNQRPVYDIFAGGFLGCFITVIGCLWLWGIIIASIMGEWRLAGQMFAVGGVIVSALVIKWSYIDK